MHPSRLLSLLLPIVLAVPLWGQAHPQPEQLVGEVVYNELHDHERHGYWRYWIERTTPDQSWLDEQIETPEGQLSLHVLDHGLPLGPSARLTEQERISHLLASPAEQARLRRDHLEDEKRIGRIVSMLPKAFSYEWLGQSGNLARLRFSPNPKDSPDSIEEKLFHAMRGELWVDLRAKRLARLEGHLDEDITFGFGLLGRLNRGGWFCLERTQASPTDWKTSRLEIHMSGRALLFKTIARQTSERRGGFVAVPANVGLAQAAQLLGNGTNPVVSMTGNRAALPMERKSSVPN